MFDCVFFELSPGYREPSTLPHNENAAPRLRATSDAPTCSLFFFLYSSFSLLLVVSRDRLFGATLLPICRAWLQYPLPFSLLSRRYRGLAVIAVPCSKRLCSTSDALQAFDIFFIFFLLFLLFDSATIRSRRSVFFSLSPSPHRHRIGSTNFPALM